MFHCGRRVLGIVAVVGILTTTLATVGVAGRASAVPLDGVVLTEVMYHAPEDGLGEDDAYDFIELQNISTEPIDMTGWRITEAVEFTFPTFALAPGSRVVIAANAASFAERYGNTPTFQVTDGRLKNSSETIQLLDSGGTLVDALTYNDDPPWPGASDGGGSSLEKVVLARKNLNDDSDADNWLASSVMNGTPGEVNSVAGQANAPLIIALGHGADRPQPSAAVRVDLSLSNATSASLRYQVMFTSPVTIPMADDSASAGGAGDGTWSAMIPGQTAGSLVRYRVTATGPGGTAVSPATGDTIDDHGYVVANPDVDTVLPMVEWFMEDAVYADLLANHRWDDVQGRAVISYDGRIWDNARMRIRGALSRGNAKPSFKVELPKGHLFTMPGISTPVDEFNMQWHQSPDLTVAWEVADGVGFPKIDHFQVRTQRNGKFWGSGGYLTALDGRWRDEHGYGDASL